MKHRLLASLVPVGVAVGVAAATPMTAAASTASSPPARIAHGSHSTHDTHRRVLTASGAFTAGLDVTSLRLQPVGSRCLLTVNGTLTFTGTIRGTATGTTAALEDAPCAAVAVNPPGTFADVFRFTGTFSGTVRGRAADAHLVYAGRTAQGGAIDAGMLFSGGVTAILRVSARVAVGGTYEGVVVRR
jgi:hypothetical protein